MNRLPADPAFIRPVPLPTGRPRFARTLGTAHLVVGRTALVAGVLLLIRPDGSLLAANPEVLSTTPFDDWAIPGLLLTAVVGGGFLIAGVAEWTALPRASEVSVAAGTGLIAFEIVQTALIGWHPMQPIMMTVALAMVVLVYLRVARPAPGLPRNRTGMEKP